MATPFRFPERHRAMSTTYVTARPENYRGRHRRPAKLIRLTALVTHVAAIIR